MDYATQENPIPRYTPRMFYEAGPLFSLGDAAATLVLGETKTGRIVGRCCVSGQFIYDLLTLDREVINEVPEWALEARD